jgi:hypothetical protein
VKDMTKYLSEFYDFAFEYLKNQTMPLIEEGKITYEQLEEYTNKTDVKSSNYSLEDAQRMIIICLQDYQSMPKVINYKDRESEINSVICDLNSKKIVEKWDGKSLYNKFCTMYPIKNQESKRNSWLKFSKSIVSSAKFLSKFDTVEEQKADLEKRFALENERYFNLYGVHKEDKANYDYVLDTTHLTREEVMEKVIEAFNKWLAE